MRRCSIIAALLFAFGAGLGAQTLTSVTVSPHFIGEITGGTYQMSVTCKYSDNSTDNCTKAGGVTWKSTQTTYITVSSTGLVSFVSDPLTVNPENCSPNCSLGAEIVAWVGSQFDFAEAFTQHSGDTWVMYTTPDLTSSSWKTTNNLTVGAVGAIGAAFQVNTQSTYQPAANACDWTSSNTAIATVTSSTSQGAYVTGVAPGTVTLTCAMPSGNAVWGSSTIGGWVSPGNTITINVTAAGTGGHTWYVRSDGGTLYSATDTNGQCDGQHDAPYPGTGTDQPCGVSTLRNLWADGVSGGSLASMHWVINGGDTVIVEPNGTTGYLLNAASYAATPAACQSVGVPSLFECVMPPVPSGSATDHTVIEGSNFANCQADSQKTKLYLSWGGFIGFFMQGSSFVDLKCFNISDQAQCGGNGNFTNHCNANSTTNYGSEGISWNALSSYNSLTDIVIHGLASEAIHGAQGFGNTGTRVRITGMPETGVDMDDGPWNSSNISVAGGMDWENSTIEFTGCVEEYPIVHNYPFIECRDQNAGGQGDAWGTGTAEGTWTFKNDIVRYNFQDGFDLLHGRIYQYTVENSIAVGNIGAPWKGNGITMTFKDNIAINDCARLSQQFGDMPAGAIVPNIAFCRAADGFNSGFSEVGTTIFEHNTYVSYFATTFDLFCDAGDYCHDNNATALDNVIIGYADANTSCGGCASPANTGPGLFFINNASAANLPGTAGTGWTTEDYNYFIGMKPGYGFCDGKQGAHDICADPKLKNEPDMSTHTVPATGESDLDAYDTSVLSTSAVLHAGTTITGIPNDMLGNAFASPSPSEGSLELGSAMPALSAADSGGSGGGGANGVMTIMGLVVSGVVVQ